MANELLNPVAILQDTMMRWENNTSFLKFVNRELDDKFAVKNEKVGYTVNLRVPVRFRGRRGDMAQPEGIQEQMVPVTINTLWGQDLEISDQDLTLTIDRFGERYIESSAAIIANMMDGDGLDLYADVYNEVGTPGTTPAFLTAYTGARVALANHACPDNDNFRSLVIDPDAEANALGFQNNLFHPQKEISDQYLYGRMGKAIGFKWSMAQNVARHTVGLVGTSTPLVNGANQTGSNLITDGWNINTTVLKRGDTITIGATAATQCVAVNPLSFRNTGKRRSFVVTADVLSDGAGNATIPVSPSISADVTSPFQTVIALPADNAAILVHNVAAASFANLSGISTPQNLAFHREAFALAVVKMETPGGLDWSEQITNPNIQIAMRLTRGFLIGSNERITRVEVLGGWKTIRPEFACRIAG